MSKKVSHIHQPDNVLMWSLAILIFFGLLMLFTSSIVLSKEKTQINNDPTTGNPTYYLVHQILYGLLPGIILAFILSRLSIDALKKIAPFFALLAIIFLIAVFIPGVAFKSGGAVRWINIGGFTFQPSEFAKLSLILYLAAFFEKKIETKKITSFKEGLLPFLIILAPFVLLLLLQPDMGTLGTLCFIALLMFFSAGGSLSHVFLLVFLGIVLLLCAIFVFDYQEERIFTFLNPEEDVLGSSYQINQSLIALGSGGVFGVGFTNGVQKEGYLPQPMNDTIFAVWGEETGFVGTTIIIILYLIICWRGFIIAKRAPNKFSQVLAIGITSWISIQTIFHIMAVCGLIPFTGIPLPFISYGGSALMCALMGIGVLINVSRRTV